MGTPAGCVVCVRKRTQGNTERLTSPLHHLVDLALDVELRMFVFTHSSLMATSSPTEMSVPK
uniref:Uncharacterized protein n=1 Tax=Anguilla anguilla TaxID=7936 RepID=A0A0E9SQG3_ANGAN